MDSYNELATAFHRRIESIAAAVDVMAPGLDRATALIVQAVMNDRKILVCACGPDRGLAIHLASLLRAPENSPPLPAIAVVSDVSGEASDGLWRDLRTLSRDGDVLLSLDTREGADFAALCDQFARERNLGVVALSDANERIAERAVTLAATGSDLRSELLLMAAHCLLDRIRQQLLGE